MKTVLAITCLVVGLTLAGCKKYDTPSQKPAVVARLPQPDMPLPDNAYKAQLVLAEPLSKLSPGQKQEIKVRVTNKSDALWIVYGTEGLKYRVAVGDSWLDNKGQLLTSMDGRIGLPANLNPGESVVVPLLITAPAKPGDYILQLDLVQELVTWFADKGSETLKVSVKVE
jgi:hypothetical protein